MSNTLRHGYAGPDEATLVRFEQLYAKGITSAKLLDVLASLRVQLTSATLRKYVQLGLLPRSVRVGRKGKHQGSEGVYPVSVIRHILRIKAMMAEDYTIEQIQRDFFFVRSDLQQLEHTLDGIFQSLGAVVKERRRESYADDIRHDIEGAKSVGKDLVARLVAIEDRLITRAQLERIPSAS